MAKIELVGYVDPWSSREEAHPDWAMKVAEPHSRKNSAGEWETVGRTWRTIKAAYGVEIDFTKFRKGDRVVIVGTEVTETSERDGKKYYTLTVKASSVESATNSADGRAPAPSDWATPASSAPAATVGDDGQPF